MIPTLLRISLKEIQVTFNGDEVLKGNKPRKPAAADDASAQDNLIVATLQYPRPGAPVVTTTKALDLPSGYKREFAESEFWEGLLFKETVCGETVLQVLVSDRDNRSTFLKMVGLILSAGIGGFVGASIKGITNVILGGIAKGVGEPLVGSIKNLGGKGNTKVIAKSADITIKTDGNALTVVAPPDTWNPGKQELKLPFTSPNALHYIDLSDSRRERQTIVDKGGPNGHVVLSIRVEAVEPTRLAV